MIPLLLAAVRVSVFSLFHPVELSVKPAPGFVVEVEAGGEVFALEGSQAAGLRIWENSVDCFVHRRTVPSKMVRVRARDGGAAQLVLSVPGRIERRFHGALEVTSEAGVLRAILTVDREIAVASVVAAESPPSATLEAMKAQAVVARSYYGASPGRHQGFDYCDTTHCQFLREPAEGAPAAAAEATRDLVLVYQGTVVQALYSASCGGRTRTPAEIGLKSDGYPYFNIECDPCRRNAREWEARLDASDAAGLPSEEARLSIGRKAGWSLIPGNNYAMERQGDQVVIRGRGAGHGIGLCQLGAAAMAGGGADFRSILSHYFPGTSVKPQATSYKLLR